MAEREQIANSSTRSSNGELYDHVFPSNWRDPPPKPNYHLLVVGGGTAGLVAAAGAAGLGARVALIERRALGGDCLNTGCVPSKALIASARQLRESGIRCSSPGEANSTFTRVMHEMRSLRAELGANDSATRFQKLGVDVFLGDGRFAGRHSLSVSGRLLKFRKALIATGAGPRIPSIPGLDPDRILTSDTLFELNQLPARLVVIGGGPIGCEMAQTFAALGSNVTMVDQGPRILASEWPAVSELLQTTLQSEGIRLHLSAHVVRVESTETNHRLIISQNGMEIPLECDTILVATGRKPQTQDLQLAMAGVQLRDNGKVQVNDFLQTTNPSIYAAGDVCSSNEFTHAADAQARIVLRNSLFYGRQRISRLLIPHCTFTTPEVAQVGIAPDELANQMEKFRSIEIPFSQIDRNVLDRKTSGSALVHCRIGSDQIVGATIIGDRAGELIHTMTMAMSLRIGLKRFSSWISCYPTQTDLFRKMGDEYQRRRVTPTVRALLRWWFR